VPVWNFRCFVAFDTFRCTWHLYDEWFHSAIESTLRLLTCVSRIRPPPNLSTWRWFVTGQRIGGLQRIILVTIHVYVWRDFLCVFHRSCGSLTKPILMVPSVVHDSPTCSSPYVCVQHLLGRTFSGDGFGNHVNRPGHDSVKVGTRGFMGSTEAID
jgi:hypothetical protein